MTPAVIDDVRGFWMQVALGLKDELVMRGKRIDELETQLHDQSLVTLSIQGLAYNALRTDGAHHKQWFLEQILQLVSTPEEYARVADEWKAGIEP